MPPGLQGAQRPSLSVVPDFVSSAGQEAIELAALAGLHLDPWQQFVLDQALGEREDGKWAAFEVGVEVARQNGKGGILEARELAGLFLLGERLIIHSAHEFGTSLEAFRRLEFLIQNTPELHARVKPKGYKHSHGEEGIEFRSGQRIRFRTRTKGGGRGFSADCLILDEAMVIPEAMHGALMPTLSARPNPQVWYTGSAVDQESMEHGLVFTRVRERARKGDNRSLAYFGWSAPAESPADVTPEMASDPASWAAGNPGLGIRIAAEHVENEQRSMDPRTFAVERLGVGDWPSLDAVKGQVLDPEKWAALEDVASAATDPVCLAFDVKPDRSGATIVAAGRRAGDDLTHVEVVERKARTGWLLDRLPELVQAHRPKKVLCAQGSPAMSVVPKLEALGVVVEVVPGPEFAQACGDFFDAVDQGTLRHLGTGELAAAVRGAVTRPLGEAWAWSRKQSTVDISPLVAATLARWGAVSAAKASAYENKELLIL